MGLFDIFRKKKEEDILGIGKLDQRLGLPNEANSANPGFSGYPSEQQGNPQFSGFSQQQYPQYPSYPQQGYSQDSQSQLLSKNLELLSAKLDSIQITMQNLSQRMANIEAKLSAADGRARMW